MKLRKKQTTPKAPETPTEERKLRSSTKKQTIESKKLELKTTVEDFSQKKRLATLEYDNFNRETFTIQKKRKRKDSERYFIRKNLEKVLQEEQGNQPLPNYFSILAGPSQFPQRKFCSVCGLTSKYNCVQCGMKYCCLKCFDQHKETRCQKFVI